MEATDLLLGADNDLQISPTGDFVFDLSDEQHISHILIADKGNFREHPLLGVGIARWLNAPNSFGEETALRNKIIANLSYDNYGGIAIDINGGFDIEINAQRIQ